MAVTTINIDSQVLTFANLAAFPITGTVKTIYIAEDTNFQYYWDGSQYVLLTTDINMPANLIFYATTAASTVIGYERLVISPDDVDYDNPAVDVPTGAITTTGQLIAELVADADIFAGNPGVINISTIGEIRRTSGSGTAEFYFEVYQKDSGGTETLRGTSNKTAPISGAVYQQFQVDCLFNNGTWLSTDRVVIKFYADRVAGGSNPNYDFLFGGANPVRTLFPISAQLLLNVPIAIGITGVTGGILDEVLLTDGSGKLGQSELKTVGGNSLFGSGDIPVGGGITIGTTAIASGTVNRILFEGAGNVVQQDSTFVWNNTDKRLILGTEAVADTNSRLVVIGKGTGTNRTFAVHNSTGTNNSLIVRDDGFVGIGTATANLSNIFRIVNSTLSYFDISADGGVQLGRNAAIFTNSGAGNNVAIAIGRNTVARATTLGSVAIGNTALAGVGNVAIGQSASAGISSGFSASGAAIAIGQSTVANTSGGGGGIAIGRSASASTNGTDNITLAQDSSITSNSSVANIMIGRFMTVSTNSRSYAYAMGSGVSSGSRATLGIDNSFSLYFNNNERSFFVNSLSNIVLRSQQSLVAGTQYDTNATNTLTLHNGVAPATNIVDSFQQYSADIVAGNAAPHFRTENGDVIKIYRVGGWGLPTGAFTRTTFATNTVTLEQLAERVAALIQDLRDNHQLLKA